MFFPNQHDQIKRAIAAFSTLFNEITIYKKTDDGKLEPFVVDFRYGPIDKYLAINEEKVIDEKIDPKYMVHQTNPRMSFELTNIDLDKQALMNQANTLYMREDSKDYVFKSGVPIVLSFDLYVRTSNQSEMFAIWENIIPFFNPHIVLRIRNAVVPVEIDSIVTLDSVTMEDNYEGGFDEQREIMSTLSFRMTYKLFFRPDRIVRNEAKKPCEIDLGPVMDGYIPIIEKVISDIHTVEVTFFDEGAEDETVTVTPVPEHPYDKKSIEGFLTKIDEKK